MHGLGNDYVYVNTFVERVDDAPRLAREVSDRHRGIGSDGLILIAPPGREDADVRMEMYNADGSRGQMCGNGIRCVAKFAHDHDISKRNPLRVATDAGVLTLLLRVGDDGKVRTVRVDMGEPILDPKRIPVALGGERVISQLLPLREAILGMTCVSMGNPHAVIFVDSLDEVPLHQWGPQVERHPLFPQRVNAHWVQIVSRDHVRMVTWERGSGPTQACGTGAAAVCVAAVLNQLTDRKLTATLPGGDLLLEWDESSNHVFKTGPATEVFSGTWPS